MFTLDQINDIQERLGSQKTLVPYLQALHAMGIDKYDSFITDGHSEYYGNDQHKVVSPSAHEKLTVAHTSNKEGMLIHLSQHEQGKINYLEMSRGLADSGIEKWTFDTRQLTITYYDKDGREILTERIE